MKIIIYLFKKYLIFINNLNLIIFYENNFIFKNNNKNTN